MLLEDKINRYVQIAVDELACDKAFVNIRDDKLLFSLGECPPHGDGKMRCHSLDDTLCALALRKGHALVIEDATVDPEFKDIAYVDSGLIVGYLGIPIVTDELGAIGTLCAITKEKRTWVRIEEKLLEGLANCIELTIQLEMREISAKALSESLSEYDQLQILLATCIDEMISVYDERLELLFASRSLTDQLEFEFVSKAIANIARTVPADMPLDEAAYESDVMVQGSSFTMRIKRTPLGQYFCTWANNIKTFH